VSKTIEVFRLKHRDPAEMLQIVTGVMQLVRSNEESDSGEVRILSVLKQAQSSMGMMGAEGMDGGMGDMGGGMGGMGGGVGGGMPGMGGGMAGMAGGTDMGMPGPGSGMMSAGFGGYGGGEIQGGLRLAIDARTKALIARGNKDAVERVKKLVAALDTSKDDLPKSIAGPENVRLVEFRHRNVFDVLTVLGQLGIHVNVHYVPRGAWQHLQTQFRAKPGGTLIATGPEKDLEEVVKLIQSLDVKEDNAKQ
jgi:type II secretory pathway component GspD/PulD (secretin)